MSADFEIPQLVGRVKFRVGAFRGTSKQVREEMTKGVLRAFNRARLEMSAWIYNNVPYDTGRMQLSGTEVLQRGASNRMLPAEIHWGFPVSTTYTYKQGPRKGSVKTFKYANFVNQMKGQTGKLGGSMPFIEPGLEALKQKLNRNLKKELGSRFPQVELQIFR